MVLKKINSKLNCSLKSCRLELVCLFDDLLNNIPCCYWDKSIYKQTISQLEILLKNNPLIIIDESIMEHFLIAYNTYNEITSIINDLSNFNNNQIIKNRQYRIPTYVSIVEGCLANLFRFITLIINQTSQKDYSNICNLNTLCDVMKKNNFEMLISKIDVNIRNAINHGTVYFVEDGKTINFNYNLNHKSCSLELKYYQFDKLIDEVYDTASAIILGISYCLNNYWNRVSINLTHESFVSWNLLCMQLSISAVRCKYINKASISNQLSLNVWIKNTDRNYIIKIAIELATMLFEKYSTFDKYFIGFNNERLASSWIRFNNNEISDMVYRKRTLEDILKEVIIRNDILIFNPSTEQIDLNEIKYFHFPNYIGDNYIITNVQDASLEDRKRLKCHLFIGDIIRKDDILKIIHNCILWLKTLKNVDSPTIHHKYGEMEADSLYINVYHYNERHNKCINPNNENFICFVDYNVSGITSLKNGGITEKIWNELYHEKIEYMDIAWREKKYSIKHINMISKNTLCPCGSGKKFKRCCMCYK